MYWTSATRKGESRKHKGLASGLHTGGYRPRALFFPQIGWNAVITKTSACRRVRGNSASGIATLQMPPEPCWNLVWASGVNYIASRSNSEFAISHDHLAFDIDCYVL